MTWREKIEYYIENRPFVCKRCEKPEIRRSFNQNYCGSLEDKMSCKFIEQRIKKSKAELERRHRLGIRNSNAWTILRFKILKRDNFTCRYCGSKAPEVKLHVDHIIARYNGGTDDISNLITACVECNYGKGIIII